MLQSALFTRARTEAPADEVAANARLLIRAGYIRKEMAGVYSYLPLGLRVLNRIVSLIRSEMETLGAEEVFLSSLQEKALWERTDRWDDAKVDAWFKTKLRAGAEVGLAFTHEEPLTRIMTDHIRSFRDLPRFIYQFQMKFRNEARAKRGIMRTREFLMKDLYSFCRDEKEHEAFYKKVTESYRRIFDAVGIGAKTFLTLASGGSFSKHSHEFQTLTPAGEDLIHRCRKCALAVNDEIAGANPTCPSCGGNTLPAEKAVEVGNIFTLGTRFSEALGLTFLDERGVSHPVFMGSYGIGPGRLMGTVVELLSDEKGIAWPRSIAPFRLHLLGLFGADPAPVRKAADRLYRALAKKGVEVLYDDRDLRAGEKFAEADLLGMPLRAVVSEKTIAAETVELTDRASGKTEHLSESAFLSRLAE